MVWQGVLQAHIEAGILKKEVTPLLIMELKVITGEGFRACEEALHETGGDIEAAQVYLRSKR